MGFFSDLKEDLSQAVNELNAQIDINEMETAEEQVEAEEQWDEEQALIENEPAPIEQALSLNEMLERMDTFELSEEFMQGGSGFEQEELLEEESFPVEGWTPSAKMSDVETEDLDDEADSFDWEPLWRKIEEESEQSMLSEERLAEPVNTPEKEQPAEWQETILEEEPEEQPEEQSEEQKKILQEEELQELQVTSQEEEEETTETKNNEDSKGAEKEMETKTVSVAVEKTSVITDGMTITGDIVTEGSVDLIGTVNGNIDASGKLNITGHVNGNSKATEIYAESAKINGDITCEGTVKIGSSSVVIGNITATSAAIAGAVKGDIDVRGPVVLDSSAIVMGNIKSKSVQIINGAVIEGMCSQCYADVNPISFFDDYKA